jgi:hypothetical protein
VMDCKAEWPLNLWHSPFLPFCPNLQKLKWIDLSLSGSDIRSSAPSVQEVLAPVAGTLRDLTLSCTGKNYGDNKRPVLKHMAVSSLPKLRKLRMENWIVEIDDDPQYVFEALFSGGVKEVEWKFWNHSAKIDRITPRMVQIMIESLRLAQKHEGGLKRVRIEAVVRQKVGGSEIETDIPSLQKNFELIQSELREKGVDIKCLVVVVRLIAGETGSI